jgi:hypothetical protein
VTRRGREIALCSRTPPPSRCRSPGGASTSHRSRLPSSSAGLLGLSTRC